MKKNIFNEITIKVRLNSENLILFIIISGAPSFLPKWGFPSVGKKLIYVFLIHFIDYAITVAPLSPLYSPPPCIRPPTHIPPFSSCPWVIQISSLASTFPIPFLPSPCLFSTYHLCYLFSVPFPLSPSHYRVDNPPCDLHFCVSIPVLVVCLVCFCFCFRCGC